MLDFSIQKQSKKSHARVGTIKTTHGIVETPAFIPVATQGVVKTLTSEEVVAVGSQMLICNTYHLHIRPGEKIVKANGGLHGMMQWNNPLMTDSGGFQVFSLGFGKEQSMGKILKKRQKPSVSADMKSKFLRITDKGVHFHSYVDGKEIFLDPKTSIKIQQALGADIMFAFDECPPPLADERYMIRSLEKTHRWAEESLSAKTTKKQSLYGIVQGGKYKNLRMQSARYIGNLPFDGFGIGGEFGFSKRAMTSMLRCVFEELPEEKPRHLLGVGHPEDILPIIKAGVDTFDCIVPTHYARRGIAFTSEGRLDLRKALFFTDKKPLDETCGCMVCGVYSRAYITHMLRAHEITPLRLLTIHNLFFFHAKVARIREDIKEGRI
ncbi:MAG: tRNA guanosine(34) transglycosylase Tgt [Candidatus Ryanbacteria bacterium CG10_big_fil_rev_8_21_14_0_10_43_42]|uniref:Queuine tRNA-ribosyltransferase n=1 Tax=Candidatus Ryanbacteria bacterium CG10_big_fil_rev_8_21_14_0_10_43_42 TaxID=1974864 RepID=A0A2M8KWS5_9BACT|nr:MAG: tRNA guanosine(34) transglycosylase Tgt [Candidatus Ryanbacteria bacterium CG10_big_fil_rev_8_21_14_0_10_43_42]